MQGLPEISYKAEEIYPAKIKVYLSIYLSVYLSIYLSKVVANMSNPFSMMMEESNNMTTYKLNDISGY